MKSQRTLDWRDVLTVLWIMIVFGANLRMMAQFLVQFLP